MVSAEGRGHVEIDLSCGMGTSVIPSGTEAMTAGNIVFGGIIGLGVDAASGAMNKYPDIVTVAMVPDQACQRPAAPRPPRAAH